VGLTMKETLEAGFENPLVAGCGLLITALLLLIGQRCERDDRSLESMTLFNAILIGLFQAVAIVPGISRSGSTIAGGMISGMRRDAAATFSFFIAIPAIAGAAVLLTRDFYESGGSINSPLALLVGGLTAFVVGLASLRFLLRLI